MGCAATKESPAPMLGAVDMKQSSPASGAINAAPAAPPPKNELAAITKAEVFADMKAELGHLRNQVASLRSVNESLRVGTRASSKSRQLRGRARAGRQTKLPAALQRFAPLSKDRAAVRAQIPVRSGAVRCTKFDHVLSHLREGSFGNRAVQLRQYSNASPLLWRHMNLASSASMAYMF